MTNWRDKKVAVLAGGPSCEREISLISGNAVAEALTLKGIFVIRLDPVGDFLTVLKKEKPAMVFLALHGTFGEDGTIQKILEEEGIPYTGCGISASETAFDKAKAQALFKKAGICIPEFMVIERGKAIRPPTKFSFPLVVKPASSGSSVGVSIHSDIGNYIQAVVTAFQYSDAVLVERYIRGRELTVGFLAGQSLPVVEVIAKRAFYDYEAKYKESGTRYEFPALLSALEERVVTGIAARAYHALGCEVMARADIILREDGKPYMLEVNTIPGLTGKSLLPKAAQARGIDFPGLCVRILDLSAERWRRKERLVSGRELKV